MLFLQEAHLSDFKNTVEYVHNLPDDKMEQFVKNNAQDIQSIVEQLFSLFGTKIGDDEGVNAILESFPEMKLERFDKFWPE